MTEKINADMIVKAFNEFSAAEFDREPMAVGKYFVVRTNADNIYRIDTAKANETENHPHNQWAGGGPQRPRPYPVQLPDG